MGGGGGAAEELGAGVPWQPLGVHVRGRWLEGAPASPILSAHAPPTVHQDGRVRGRWRPPGPTDPRQCPIVPSARR